MRSPRSGEWRFGRYGDQVRDKDGERQETQKRQATGGWLHRSKPKRLIHTRTKSDLVLAYRRPRSTSRQYEEQPNTVPGITARKFVLLNIFLTQNVSNIDLDSTRAKRNCSFLASPTTLGRDEVQIRKKYQSKNMSPHSIDKMNHCTHVKLTIDGDNSTNPSNSREYDYF